MADIENTLKEQITPALADGEFATALGEKYFSIVQRTEGRFEILGKSMHKDIFQLATRNEEVREELVTAVQNIKNDVKQAVNDKIEANNYQFKF